MVAKAVQGGGPYRQAFAAARRTVRAKLRLVTPDQAEKWLATANRKNRPLSPVFAGRYAADMKGGRWAVNGQGVVFDTDGHLIDGQHRLKAVVLSGASVPLLVVSGVPAGVFDTLDQGRRRSFGQYLAMDGERQAATLAAAVFWVQVLTGGGPSAVANGRCRSIADQYAALAEHPGLRDSVTYVRGHIKKGVFEPGPFTALHYVATRKHPGEATGGFFEKLFTGVGLTKAEPVYWLREQLHDGGSKRMPPLHKMAIATKALNATWGGRPLKVLKWSEAELFPTLE